MNSMHADHWQRVSFPALRVGWPTGMSLEQAARYGVASEQHRNHVRAAFTKSNYGPPLTVRWLKRSEEFEGILEPCVFDEQESVASPI